MTFQEEMHTVIKNFIKIKFEKKNTEKTKKLL